MTDDYFHEEHVKYAKDYAINLIHERIGDIPKNWKKDNPDFKRMSPYQKRKAQETIDEYVEMIFKLVTPVQIDI